jgi:hypothetical protein
VDNKRNVLTKIQGAIITTLLIISPKTFAADQTVQQNITEQSSLIEANVRFVRFTGSGVSISISGYGAGYTRYVSPKLGLSFDVGQLFGKDAGKTSAMVTSFGFSAKYRPFVGHQIYREAIALDGRSFINTQYPRVGGLNLALGMTQQLLNAAEGVVPYNGIVLGFGYDVPFGESWIGQFSVNQASVSNDKANIKILSALLGFGYAI